MANNQFNLTSSFTKRLRGILIIIAAFFVLGVVSSYYTSQDLLNGLQRINSANRVLNLTALSLESIGTSDQNLDKLSSTKDVKNIRFAFQQSVALTHEQLNLAIRHSIDFPMAHKLLKQAQAAIDEYSKSAEELFLIAIEFEDAKVPTDEETVRSVLLVTGEFSSDAKESLRQVQITLKKRSDKIFDSIYSQRFDPLKVASILSVLFFSFVIIVGLSTAKRLGLALSNLTSATDAVSKGNLGFVAPVLEKDEFGKLTHEFNGMVLSLHENQQQLNKAVEKLTRLQEITSSLAGAIEPQQVFKVIFESAFKTLNVSQGAVGLIDNTRENVNVQGMIGYSEDVQQQWKSFPITTPVPLADVIKDGQAIFLSSMEEIKTRYPIVYSIQKVVGNQAVACLPLVVEGKAVGSISFSFKEEQAFSDSDKEFLYAMVGQCSQAFHRAQLFEAAREAIKVRDEFLSIASHELRTPLTPLKLQLQNLARQVRKGKDLSPEQLMKTVDSSDKQVSRLANLIDDLLDVSRISSGKLTLNREAFNFSEMIDEVVSHYTHQLKEVNSVILTDTDKSIVGYFDKVRVEQVFINLLTNAAKYAPGKQIKVSLHKAGEFAELKVSDKGQGISIENHQRIFDRFERVRDRDNVGGLGLGLYISRQIVEAHNGFIRVESIPGEGSTFIVQLPLNPERNQTHG